MPPASPGPVRASRSRRLRRRSWPWVLLSAVVAAGIATTSAGGSARLCSDAELIVQSTRGSANETQVALWPSECADPLGGPPLTYSASLYVPAGYHLDLDLRPGTPVGGVSAGGSLGVLTVGDPATDTADGCAPGPHAALWTSDLQVSGRSLPIRIFVDPTTADAASLGAYRLSYCITYPPNLILDDLTAPSAPGVYTWRGFVTPPEAGVPFPAETYEVRAVVPIPHVITAKTRYLKRWQTLLVSGRVSVVGKPEAGAYVDLARRRGTRATLLAEVRARADGTFTFKTVVHQKRVRQTLDFEATGYASGPCADPSPAPRGCGNQTSSFTTTSFAATIPKR